MKSPIHNETERLFVIFPLQIEVSVNRAFLTLITLSGLTWKRYIQFDLLYSYMSVILVILLLRFCVLLISIDEPCQHEQLITFSSEMQCILLFILFGHFSDQYLCCLDVDLLEMNLQVSYIWTVFEQS